MKLKQIVEGTDTAVGRGFDLVIQLLIVGSLVSFSIETLPGLSETTRNVLAMSERVMVAVFTMEYVLRIAVADRKLRQLFSFYGLVDLAAILPFYLATGLDLRSIRIVRLFRVFRVFKLLRYNAALDRFRRAFFSIREELLLVLMAAVLMLYLSAVGIYYFERDAQPEVFSSVFHSLWWAVTTLTTVGYGDAYPVTVGGKLFTFVVLVVGLGVVAVPTGLLATAFLDSGRHDKKNAG